MNLQAINTHLQKLLQQYPSQHSTLQDAMCYVVMSPGKRIRPLLVSTLANALGAPDQESILNVACAVELIHCYSLVHDDLPAMDDDDMRRGQPSCHKAFDEATAILVGDALQALAFELLPNIKMVHCLCKAIGNRGMVAGQMLDLSHTCNSLEEIEHLHQLKTGALLEACVELAIILKDKQDKTAIDALKHYGKAIGLAFQIQDDILDHEQESNTSKNYLNLAGQNNTTTKLETLKSQALTALNTAKLNDQSLIDLTEYIFTRDQ